jgi:glycogen debranching enzyme
MKELAIEDVIQNRMPWIRTDEADPVLLLTREWLVTNGLGGYASASVSGACTRRYHGLLISALPAPLGRMVMLSHFSEEIALPDESVIDFSGEELTEEHLDLHSAEFLSEFRLEAGLPIWRYDVRGCVIEKRVVMPHLQNTVHITYRLLCKEGMIRKAVSGDGHRQSVRSIGWRQHTSASIPARGPERRLRSSGRTFQKHFLSRGTKPWV